MVLVRLSWIAMVWYGMMYRVRTYVVLLYPVGLLQVRNTSACLCVPVG